MENRLYLVCPLCGSKSVVVTTITGDVLFEGGLPSGKKQIVVVQKTDLCTCTECESTGALSTYRKG